MAQQSRIWILAGALALASLAPASAQVVTPSAGPTLRDYSGVITPNGFMPPRLPSHWIVPNPIYFYQAPVPIVVHVAPAPERPAVAVVQVERVTLGKDARLADIRVKPGTVVTWVNATDRELGVAIRPSELRATESAITARIWQVRPNGSFSLAFHQPGVYDYYVQDKPEQRARLIVEAERPTADAR